MLNGYVRSGGYSLLYDHGVGARGNVFESFVNNRLSQHACGGGAVAGDVVCLRGHFLYKLSAHIFKRIGKLYLLGDGHAVVGDERSAVFFVKHNVAALGSQRDFNGVCKRINAGLERLSRLFAGLDLFCHIKDPPYSSTTAKMSL